MHVTLVEINVHEDKVDEFIEVFRQNHLGSVHEDAVAFHKTTPHYKTCVAKLEALMTGPRKKRLFNGLMP